MQFIQGGICAPGGFKASGVSADIKGKKTDKKDVAIIYSEQAATAAGVFTTNRVKAAPVIISQQKISNHVLQAIVINSGNANACTGAQGMTDAVDMCQQTAKALGIDVDLVAVASTGVIGVNLPMKKIQLGIQQAAKALSHQGSAAAAAAIMTTDTFPKEIAIEIDVAGVPIKIGGIAKGSGMIFPNMATTLGFVTTDAAVSAMALQKALKLAIETSFNMITVDGDTSTNDCVISLANGMAGNPEIHPDSPTFSYFVAGLTYVLTHLAKAVVRDGEGATKLMEMQVHGASTQEDARKAALAVCNSALVKTALFGSDANWGRILCALGYSGAQFDPNKVDLYIGNVPVMQKGAGLAFDETAAAAVLAEKEIIIKAYLHNGSASATAWGCDLSHDYVTINGSYRS